MGKTVVIAEKPSVGRDLARVLNCTENKNGFIEGKQYIVTWALGHLVTLAEPESYGENYQSWKLEELPMLPNPLKLVVIKQTQKQFYTVKAQLLRKDVDSIVIATDAGREGELVARWILDKVRTNKIIKRLWISSVTDKAIKEGFKNLKEGKRYDGLYQSAVARAEADWYVGINGTRALTTKFNAPLSCGRVQTPTLAMIDKREAEIQSHQAKPYWQLSASVEDFNLDWVDQKVGEKRIFSKEKLEKIENDLKGKSILITQVKTSKKKTPAPPLYDLTELQRDAHGKYGYSAKETLNTLQKLYETHKAVTYPRTDSKALSSDLVDTLEDRLKACDVQPYRKHIAEIRKKPLRPQKHVINDKLVTDHHAIIPTEQVVTTKLSDRERKVYDLIVTRFIAVFYPHFEYEHTTLEATSGPHLFRNSIQRTISDGWKAVLNKGNSEREENVNSSLLVQGRSYEIKKLSSSEGVTKPPARLTEATLLTAMEKPAAFLEQKSEQLVTTLGKAGGIGTVATRADIIEKLFQNFLIEKKGSFLHLTSKGKQLLTLVPTELKSPALTAEWEDQLEKISKGELSKKHFIDEIKKYATSIVKDIKQSSQTFKHDNVTGSKCPECGKLLLEVNGKKGKMKVCQDRQCGYKKRLAIITNARCPKCKKKLELRGEGEGQTFACICGHREKKTAFEKRKKETQHKKVSKKEVHQYMKKQNNDQDFQNSALADALKKLNLDKE
ncbi:DNA topoisomerase III [Bacillus sp. TS-2]|nr:DNA topoisomerase III [Bacillus sp. TS-2]